MSGADMKSCSTWTSGSVRLRPARRTKEETVFLRLEISWFLAVSPTYLLLGPKPTSDGVARLETSFAIYWRQYFGVSYATGATHHIDTAIPRNSNDAVERSQINTYYRHVYL